MAVLLVLAGCVSSGALRPGVATLDEVRARLGTPAMEWRDRDGSLQLAYPQGPLGYQTLMVFIGPDGRLRSLENVLDAAHLARIQPGVSDRIFVTRLLGPPRQVTNFDRRNEEAWEWRFKDVWLAPSRLIVTFDRATGLVKERYELPETRLDGLLFRGMVPMTVP